jgi:hypothetical protein
MRYAYCVVRTTRATGPGEQSLPLNILPVCEQWRNIPEHPLLNDPQVKYDLSPFSLYSDSGMKLLVGAGIPVDPNHLNDTVKILYKPTWDVTGAEGYLKLAVEDYTSTLLIGYNYDFELKWTSNKLYVPGRTHFMHSSGTWDGSHLAPKMTKTGQQS